MSRRQTMILVGIGLVVVLLCASLVLSNAVAFGSTNQNRVGETVQLDGNVHISSIELPQAIAEDIQEELIEVAENQEGLPYWAVQPTHIEVYFDNYVLDDTFHEPRIYLYSVDALLDTNPLTSEQIDVLHTLLTDPAAMHKNVLPMLPLMNATQMMQAQIQQLDFKNGSGIRYLTQMGQAPLPINNSELFYTFQGFTDDRSVYVAAILPVSNAILDATTSETSNTNIADQITRTAAILDQAAASSFVPSLVQLDAMITSIEVR